MYAVFRNNKNFEEKSKVRIIYCCLTLQWAHNNKYISNFQSNLIASLHICYFGPKSSWYDLPRFVLSAWKAIYALHLWPFHHLYICVYVISSSGWKIWWSVEARCALYAEWGIISNFSSQIISNSYCCNVEVRNYRKQHFCQHYSSFTIHILFYLRSSWRNEYACPKLLSNLSIIPVTVICCLEPSN